MFPSLRPVGDVSPRTSKRLAKRLRLPLGILLLVFSFVSVAAAAEKRVLFIHTNKSNGPGVILYDKAFQAALSGNLSEQITLYNEYTDLWRFVGEDYGRALNDFYRQKYAGQHFDLIVVESPPALKFLLTYGDELFPGTPVVFCTMETRLVEGLSLKPNFTGFTTDLDFKKSLESALRLQPDTRRVVVVGGTSPLDQSYLAIAQKAFQQFEGQVEFTYLADLPLEEIESQVSKLPAHSIVYYVNLSRDSTGQSFPPAESAARIGKAANSPFYSSVEVFIQSAGGVGGYLWSSEADAMEAAKTARRILAGAKPQDLPIYVGDSNRYIFDWRQLRRWGINENRLPPGSIVGFKQPTFWEQYKWRIVGVLSISILETLLIGWLLLSRARLRQAQRESERFAELARAQHRRLEEVLSNVPGMVWEVSIEPGSGEQKTQFVSRFVEQMSGYRPEDFLTTTGLRLSLIPEEDRERVERETNEIFAKGKSGTIQYRWLNRSGRMLWVEEQIAVMRDEHDRPIGLRGVAMDITDRKVAEEAVRQSEERNRDILRAIPDLMFLQNAEGVYLDFHAKDPRDLFVPPAAFLGKNMRDVLPAELYEEISRCFRRAVETDEPQILEYTLPMQSGERWFEARMVRSKGDQILSVVRDVTTRKRQERALRESEEQFGKAFNANPQPMSLTTLAEGRYIDVNESFLKTSGYRREEVIGRTSLELGIWETPATRVWFMQQLTEQGVIRNVETNFGTKDGSVRVFLSSAELVKIGGEQCILVASSDITDRKQTEFALRSAKDELQMVADALPFLISQVDKNGCYRFSNLAYWKWFGQPSDQIVGRHMRDVLGEAVWNRIRPQVESTLAGHEVHYEDLLPYRHGGSRWVSVTGIPTRDADGEVNGFVSLVADITESRRAKEALRDLSGRLISAQEEERSRVARELHDDLSQKLALLSIGLEQIGQQIPEGPNNLHARIHGLWTQAQEISTELHRVSYQLHPSKLDHLGLVAAVRSFCEELAAHHGLSIKFRQEGFPATLSKDITLCVFRIAQESLHNAVKHSGAREAQVVLEKTDHTVRLSVSDTGCGFDTKSDKMTSGLGFTSMKERLRLVGGQLSIRSHPFQGTQIEVTVPLIKGAEAASVGSSGQRGD